MVDFKLDPVTNDMVIENGKIATISDPIEIAKQRLRMALQTHRGEWLFDIEHGLPWTDEILTKNPDLGQVASRIRAYVLTLEGFIGVRSCVVTLGPPEERTMLIDLDVEVPEGLTGPFRVTVGL